MAREKTRPSTDHLAPPPTITKGRPDVYGGPTARLKAVLSDDYFAPDVLLRIRKAIIYRLDFLELPKAKELNEFETKVVLTISQEVETVPAIRERVYEALSAKLHGITMGIAAKEIGDDIVLFTRSKSNRSEQAVGTSSATWATIEGVELPSRKTKLQCMSQPMETRRSGSPPMTSAAPNSVESSPVIDLPSDIASSPPLLRLADTTPKSVSFIDLTSDNPPSLVRNSVAITTSAPSTTKSVSSIADDTWLVHSPLPRSGIFLQRTFTRTRPATQSPQSGGVRWNRPPISIAPNLLNTAAAASVNEWSRPRRLANSTLFGQPVGFDIGGLLYTGADEEDSISEDNSGETCSDEDN